MIIYRKLYTTTRDGSNRYLIDMTQRNTENTIRDGRYHGR